MNIVNVSTDYNLLYYNIHQHWFSIVGTFLLNQ